VTWDSHHSTVPQFQRLGQDVLTSATQKCAQLMYGWRPTIDLARVRDRIATLEDGYSFVSDPRNGLAEAYLILSDRACTAEMDGLMTVSGWDLSAVRSFLAHEEELLPELACLSSHAILC
jgi:hypothetical protein